MDNFKQIEMLELELADPIKRSNVSRVSELIADDFQEIGSSGSVIQKKDVIEWAERGDPVKYEIIGFKYKSLSDNCILVTYETHISKKKALRSSIWVKNKVGWQMLHHQATVVTSNI
jgi:hypothetical protein